jgi:AraC-like DNA-binding protein
MITTFEIVPAPLLAPFVRCYSYIEFDTNGLEFIRPTNAWHEIAMTFQFKTRPVRAIDSHIVQSFKNCYGGAIGLFTQDNGDMVFNGHYIFFEIMFRPTGFHKIFRLPPGEINNQMAFAENVFQPDVKVFYEQLGAAAGFSEMCVLADAYLSGYLKKQKRVDYKDGLTCMSNTILKNNGMVSIDKLAYDANMSVRSFERHFIDQVGIPAKLFCNITRFNHALALKFKNPQMDWTAIALACGYYDQTHLIKDFKKFAGDTPAVFQQETHLAHVNFESRVEP